MLMTENTVEPELSKFGGFENESRMNKLVETGQLLTVND